MHNKVISLHKKRNDMANVIPAYLKRFPEEVVNKALEKYPLDYETVYDEQTRLPLWEEDVNQIPRHAYILGYMDALK